MCSKGNLFPVRFVARSRALNQTRHVNRVRSTFDVIHFHWEQSREGCFFSLRRVKGSHDAPSSTWLGSSWEIVSGETTLPLAPSGHAPAGGPGIATPTRLDLRLRRGGGAGPGRTGAGGLGRSGSENCSCSSDCTRYRSRSHSERPSLPVAVSSVASPSVASCHHHTTATHSTPPEG